MMSRWIPLCRRHCIYDNYDLRKFIAKGRAKAFEQGLIPEETKKRIETFVQFGNPHGEREPLEKGTGDTGHFVSCSAYKDREMSEAMNRILSVSGEQVREFGGADICCGAPLYYAGYMDGFETVAGRMKEEIEKRGLHKVIVDCPNCLKMMTELYKEVGVELDVEFVHTTEFLQTLLEQGKLKVRKAKDIVTYHDPCILANDMGNTAAPRKVLELLGFEVKEPVHTQEHTHCCGGPCGARIGDCTLAENVTSMRIDELKQTGADIYISACATCKSVLSELDVKDMTELVAERILDG